MRHRIAVGVCAALAVCSAARVTLAAETAHDTRTAPQLVTAALAAEAVGDAESHTALLEQALQLDPDYGPARWHSGYVQWNGRWVKTNDVPKLADDDERLAAYRTRRDALIDTADNHKQLARWCRKQKLADEERIHWAKALEYDAQDAEAIKGLGLQQYQGRLLTARQIETEKRRLGERLQAMRHWRPIVARWRTTIERGDAKAASEATAAILAVSDPEALGALEATLALDRINGKSEHLNLLLVEVASKIAAPEATQVLLRRAVLCDSDEVRAAAAEALKKRPMHAYVPLLIAALPSALETNYRIQVLPGGAVVHEHEIHLKGPSEDYTLTYESIVHPIEVLTSPLVTPAGLNRELVKAAQIERQLQAGRRDQDRLRQRIEAVLKATTGFEDAQDPQLWLKQYADYYGWERPKAELPEREFAWDYTAIYPIPVAPTPRTSRPPSAPAPATVTTTRSLSGTIMGECFAAGTPVVALHGVVPIEQLRQGDRVLSQDLTTGELAYKPVLSRTLRRCPNLLKLSVGDESLLATPGHTFWVTSQGWQVAKHISLGDRLQGIGRTAAVDSIEPAAGAEVYNLVVADFATFFVGEQRLLVHDDTPLEEQAGVGPGLAELDIRKGR